MLRHQAEEVVGELLLPGFGDVRRIVACASQHVADFEQKRVEQGLGNFLAIGARLAGVLLAGEFIVFQQPGHLVVIQHCHRLPQGCGHDVYVDRAWEFENHVERDDYRLPGEVRTRRLYLDQLVGVEDYQRAGGDSVVPAADSRRAASGYAEADEESVEGERVDSAQHLGVEVPARQVEVPDGVTVASFEQVSHVEAQVFVPIH